MFVSDKTTSYNTVIQAELCKSCRVMFLYRIW